jgi:histidinol-phosphate aminotransferase
VIVSRTFSKAYALAGLRVGYAVTDRDTACILNKVREPFNVNLLAQKAALAALQDEVYMNRCLDFIKAEKERFYSFFETIGMSYIKSSTNFVLVNTGMDSTEISSTLLKKGVIIRDMASWGMKGHVRVNAGTKEENDRFFKCFKETVADIRDGNELA